MGWVWRDNEDDDDGYQFNASSSSEIISSNREQCSTRKIVSSQCKTEEVDPGKFIRRCEKTEELLKECVGKPVEVMQSNKEYTEEDVTNEVLRGGSDMFGSSDRGVFDFPGLRSDIEIMERNLFGDLSRFMEAAEETRSGFFDIFAKSPSIFDSDQSSLPSMRRGIPIPTEEHHQQEASPKPKEKKSTNADFIAMAKDV